MCADSRFAKPQNSLARAACGPGRGKLSACQKVPERNGFTFFSLLRKEPKVAQRAAALSTPRDGSKLYRLYFFVIFPPSVPKPAYGATRFFGCFEPVRKGYCSADARLMFFGKGLLYSKLTGASRIRKGKLHVIFVAVGI